MQFCGVRITAPVFDQSMPVHMPMHTCISSHDDRRALSTTRGLGNAAFIAPTLECSLVFWADRTGSWFGRALGLWLWRPRCPGNGPAATRGVTRYRYCAQHWRGCTGNQRFSCCPSCLCSSCCACSGIVACPVRLASRSKHALHRHHRCGRVLLIHAPARTELKGTSRGAWTAGCARGPPGWAHPSEPAAPLCCCAMLEIVGFLVSGAPLAASPQ